MRPPLDGQLRLAARALRAEGLSIRDIARKLGVHTKRVAPVVGDVDYTPRVSAPISPEQTELRERACAMRKSGSSHVKIAAVLGVHRSTIGDWLRKASKDPARPLPPRRRSQTIPRWVRKADLTTDFLDFRRIYGEFGACRECRRLLAEARVD